MLQVTCRFYSVCLRILCAELIYNIRHYRYTVRLSTSIYTYALVIARYLSWPAVTLKNKHFLEFLLSELHIKDIEKKIRLLARILSTVINRNINQE